MEYTYSVQYNMHAIIHARVVWVITSCKRHPYVQVGMYIYTYPSLIRRQSRVQDIWQGYITMHASVRVNEVLYNPVAWAGTCLTGRMTWMGLVKVGAGDGCRRCVQWQLAGYCSGAGHVAFVIHGV